MILPPLALVIEICHFLPYFTEYKVLVCTPQGNLKVTEGAPYFHYIGAWGPHLGEGGGGGGGADMTLALMCTSMTGFRYVQ